MASVNRSTLKGYFETGDKPTQQQFVDLIDSFVHQTDNDTPITDTLQISGSDTYISGSTSMLLGAAITGSILPGDSMKLFLVMKILILIYGKQMMQIVELFKLYQMQQTLKMVDLL